MDAAPGYQVNEKSTKFISEKFLNRITQDKLKSGCARAEGIIRYSWEEKLAQRLKLYKKGELSGLTFQHGTVPYVIIKRPAKTGVDEASRMARAKRRRPIDRSRIAHAA